MLQGNDAGCVCRRKQKFSSQNCQLYFYKYVLARLVIVAVMVIGYVFPSNVTFHKINLLTYRTVQLFKYLTIIPRAPMGSEAIALVAMRARGIIVLVKSN